MILAKEVPNLYAAHYEMLNNMKGDRNKLGDISCSWTGTFENDTTSQKGLSSQCFDPKIDVEITKHLGKES